MKLTKTQWWLKQHQITAFWHEFGISKSLCEINSESIYHGYGSIKKCIQ